MAAQMQLSILEVGAAAQEMADSPRVQVAEALVVQALYLYVIHMLPKLMQV
jgi:hypothetical protein